MHTLNPDVRRVEQAIRMLDMEIDAMHLMVHQYLTDRSKYPHPRHEALIQRIINYQIRGLRSKELELRLESVQFKAFNRSRIWKQWFEDDAKGLFPKGQINMAKSKPEKTEDTLIDKIYSRAKDTWAKYGVTDMESKGEFKKRILQQLETARENLKKGQKIIFTYDKNTHMSHIRIEDE